MAQALKSPSYEGYSAGRSLPIFTKHVFQQSTEQDKALAKFELSRINQISARKNNVSQTRC